MKKTIIGSYLKSLPIATETIDFQSGKFGAELEALITEFRQKYSTPKEFEDSKTSSKISEIIKKHTGMLINIDIDYFSTYYNVGPAIELPSLSNNHLFRNNLLKEYSDTTTSQALIKKLENNKGKNGVNLKTSRVFGVFEDIESRMLLTANEIINKDYCFVEQLVGVMLHEIGHLFTYFEYFNRTVTTNQVLSNLTEALSKEDDDGIRQNMIQQAAYALSYDEELPKDVTQEKDPRKIAIKLMRYFTIKSGTGSSKYDESNCETLADQFAIRQGYGLPLATFLEKISSTEISRRKIERSAIYIHETFCFILGAGGAANGAMLATAGFTSSLLLPALVLISTFYLACLAFTFGLDSATFYNDYDTLPNRFKKIKEQLIQSTRVKGRTKEEIKRILDQIESLDKIISYTVDRGELLRMIADFLRPSNKGIVANLQLNRRLEELASNDLFTSAAKLKTLI